MTKLENGSGSVHGVTKEQKTHKGGQRHEGQRRDIMGALSDRRQVRGSNWKLIAGKSTAMLEKTNIQVQKPHQIPSYLDGGKKKKSIPGLIF